MNITKKKVVDSVLKKQKNIFFNISNYQDISVQTRQLFANFPPVKFCLHDRAAPNSVGINHL